MKLIVNPHKIEIEKSPVNEREVNITKCEFEFADEITNEFVKEAYFTFKGNTYKQIIFNNECDIPSEVLTEQGQIEIGVVAFKIDNELIRYNPSPAYFNSWIGSLKDNAENSDPITPSEMEQYEQALQEGLEEVNSKLPEINQAIEDVNNAIAETNNLDLDVSKSGKTATVTLTKKDATTKTVTLSDGTSLMFNWDGTRLGIKTDEDVDYTYVDLQGIQGPIGPQGEAFQIKKTYSSVAEMNADFNNMQLGDYVMIASTVEIEDNAKLYTRGEEQWIFISDFSGAQGIKGETGATPNIQIGTVTSGTTPSVTRTGTNENPVLNFVLEKGDKGDTGNTGPTGATGNGISSIEKTSTSGLVDTYTITYTDGTTTTFEVTNGEDGVTQAQLDALENKVEHYKKYSNALAKVSASGTQLTIDDTAECPMPMELPPSELEQETTTGKQLFNKNELSSENARLSATGGSYAEDEVGLNSFISGYIKVEPNVTYTVNYVVSNTTRICFYSNTEPTSFISKNDDSPTFTIPANANYLRFCNLKTAINEIQLEQGSSATDYEPYTGGIPSPNPDYPQDIHTISGDNEIKVENKNLITTENHNLGIGSGGAITSISGRNAYYCQAKPNTTYYITRTGVGTASYWWVAFTDTIPKGGITALSYRNMGNTTLQDNITSPEGTKYIAIFMGTGISENVMVSTLNNISYIPHKEYSLPLTLGDLEYCKIGNYADEFYLATESDTGLTAGKWYLKKNIRIRTITTVSEVGTASSGIKYAKCGVASNTANNTMIYCSKYIRSTNANINNSIRILPSGTLYVYDNRFTDTDVALSYLNGLKYYYQLDTSKYTLLNNTLQTQLDNIYEWAISYQGQTNISQVNDDLPFNIKAKACYDLNKLIERVTTLEGTQL